MDYSCWNGQSLAKLLTGKLQEDSQVRSLQTVLLSIKYHLYSLLRWHNRSDALHNWQGIFADLITIWPSGPNPLNTKLNPICHLLVLLKAHHILHFSRVIFGNIFQGEKCLGRVTWWVVAFFSPKSGNMINEVYTFKKHVACRSSFKCHQQMAIYAVEPQGAGKQTTHVLNHGISV